MTDSDQSRTYLSTIWNQSFLLLPYDFKFKRIANGRVSPGKNSAVGEHGRNKITTIYQQISTSQGKNTAVGEHGHNSLVQ